jgi:hypothetical protein
VQFAVAPELIVVGAQARVVTAVAGGATVTDAVAVLPFSEAVTVTAWLDVTVPAVAVNLPVVAPAATETDAGTVNAALLSDIARVAPPLGAACEIVAVHVVVAPELTDTGEHASDVTVVAGGMTVTEAVAEAPFNDAVIVTD